MASGNEGSSKRTRFTVDTGQRRRYEIEVVEHEIAVRGLPDEVDSVTFVHLSDIHAGYGGTDPVFELAIERINQCAPDFVVITGDFIDDHAAKGYPMPDLLQRINSKIYVSLGNHDHRRGSENSIRLLQQSGVTLLNNQSLRTDTGVWIVGVDDYYEGAPDLELGFREVPPGVTSVLMSHNPTLIEHVGERDTIQLSGHTHGGQIALPFPSPRLVVKLHLKCDYVAGWYYNKKAKLYVSRGLGVTGKPFRYRCPAEIAVFKLVK